MCFLQPQDLLTPIYQGDDSSITAMWDVIETEGAIERVYYSVGTYPSSSDIINATRTTMNYIPFGVFEPNAKGKAIPLHVYTYFMIQKVRVLKSRMIFV